jgi:hypothetical protein
VHDAQGIPHQLGVTPEEVTRHCNPPVPWVDIR